MTREPPPRKPPRAPRTSDDRGPARTHYQTLGVDPAATADQIRRAYRALAKQHHPDTGPSGSSAMFAALAAAYEVLSDPANRLAYDESLAQSAADESTRSGQAHYVWENIAAPRRGERTRIAEFDELYDTFFGDHPQ